MALTLYGPIVEAISGSIGGTTFARSTSGPGARRRAGPPNADTPDQSQARLHLATVAKLWGTLSSTHQQLWRVAAQGQQYLSRLGKVRTYTGWAYYNQLNQRLLAQGLAPIPVPPATPENQPLTHAGAWIDLTGGITSHIWIYWQAPGTGTPSILIDATQPTNWGRIPPAGQYRAITALLASSSIPTDVLPAYLDTYGYTPGSTPWLTRFRLTPTNTTSGQIDTPREILAYAPGPPAASPPAPASTPAGAPLLDPATIYTYTVDAPSPYYWQLDVTPGLNYQLTWLWGPNGVAAQLLFGPSSMSLSTLAIMTQYDMPAWTAIAGMVYYVQVPYAPSGNTGTIMFNPEALPITLTSDDGTTDVGTWNPFELIRTTP